MVKRNLNDKVKVSNAEILAFSYARKICVIKADFWSISSMHVEAVMCWNAGLPGEITQSNGHYAVQGHSRSPILVPIESSYTTFYQWLILTCLLSCTVAKLWLIIGQFFARETGALAIGVICEYRHKWYITITKNFSAAENIGVSSTTFTQSAPKATEFGEITQRLGLLRRSRSFKATEFGTNRKLICDFLLVITYLLSCPVSEI